MSVSPADAGGGQTADAPDRPLGFVAHSKDQAVQTREGLLCRRIELSGLRIIEVAKPLCQMQEILRFSPGSAGDLQKVRIVFRTFTGCALQNVAATELAALRIWLVIP